MENICKYGSDEYWDRSFEREKELAPIEVELGKLEDDIEREMSGVKEQAENAYACHDHNCLTQYFSESMRTYALTGERIDPNWSKMLERLGSISNDMLLLSLRIVRVTEATNRAALCIAKKIAGKK